MDRAQLQLRFMRILGAVAQQAELARERKDPECAKLADQWWRQARTVLTEFERDKFSLEQARLVQRCLWLGLQNLKLCQKFGVDPNTPFHEYMQQVGSKGGQARAKSLTAAERRAIGKKAAKARWSKKGGQS